MTRFRGATTPPRTTTRATERIHAFREAERRVLEQYGVAADSRFVEIEAGRRRAHVLVAGEGPPLVMVIGGTIPAAFWAPLMAHLPGRSLYAMDLPGFGLTDPVGYHPETYRATAVTFLAEVLDGLGIDRGQFVTNSMGSLWTHWLAQQEPSRVEAQAMIGCPALFLGTSAVLPMRLVSVPGVGRVLMSAPPSAGQVERIMRSVGEDPRGIEDVRDLLLACQRLPAYAGSMIEMMRSVMSWASVRRGVSTGPDELRAVRHPVHLTWGENDPFGSVDVGRRIAELVPGAGFSVVPGGHAPWLHHAEQVAAGVRGFLAA